MEDTSPICPLRSHLLIHSYYPDYFVMITLFWISHISYHASHIPRALPYSFLRLFDSASKHFSSVFPYDHPFFFAFGESSTEHGSFSHRDLYPSNSPFNSNQRPISSNNQPCVFVVCAFNLLRKPWRLLKFHILSHCDHVPCLRVFNHASFSFDCSFHLLYSHTFLS